MYLLARKTYPFQLIRLALVFRHPLSHAIGIPECPYGQLMENPDFGEDVKVSKPLGLLVVTVRVEGWRFGKVLPTGVFIPDIVTVSEMLVRPRE